MASVQSVLVFGASRGIGLGLVQQALVTHQTATIFATARDPTRAVSLVTLSEKSNGRVKIIVADAVDPKSIEHVAEDIKKTNSALDLVIYNSGVSNGFGNLLDVGIQGLKDNFDVNVFGAYYAAVAFVPLLLKSTYTKKSLVLLSSTFGSLALSTQILAAHEKIQGATGYDATALYNISKTALNQLGVQLDHVLRPQGVLVLLVHPGIVSTDMNPFGGISPEESASGILKVVESFPSAPGKNFVGYDGQVLPW
ncbi:hypothetical protein OIDMADRAFT_59488 [Oidiodendron maius Zn]|uniref:NAD(P)-binding protein n=1 Tax=Oidiodendron maius (strain Zn) TaxID=913774 RepID=A0A0C3D1D9_OIDMZ|nr:hypothetical protein OIDMADRAFT_59488 [Oidiodendron maius Zn]